MQLILKDGSRYEPEIDYVNELAKLFPNVNINKELTKMAAWCLSNPDKRKTRRGIKKFIGNWLTKVFDNATVSNRPKNNVKLDMLANGRDILLDQGHDTFDKWCCDNKITKYDRDCIMGSAVGMGDKADSLSRGIFKN